MKVLLPIDGSEAAERTVNWAMGFLDKTHARIFLLHVVDARLASTMAQLERGDAQRLLEQTSKHLESHGFRVAEAMAVTGIPAESICQYADKKEVQFIIIGSHGRQGLGKFLMGSVSSEVFKNAKQHVMVLNNTPRPSLTIPLGVQEHE